jgi:hypothetical protein
MHGQRELEKQAHLLRGLKLDFTMDDARLVDIGKVRRGVRGR